MIKSILKELKDIHINLDGFSWRGMYDDVQKISDFIEYSKGGENSIFGIYPPEPFSAKVCSNLKPGKKIKDISKGYTYKYYFRNDQLIAIERYMEGHLYHFITFFNLGDERRIIMFDVGENKISFVAKCQYDEKGKLKRYVHGHYFTGFLNRIKEMEFNHTNVDVFVQYRKIMKDIDAQYYMTEEIWKMTKDDVEFISKRKYTRTEV